MRKPDGDLKYALEYNLQDGYTVQDIKNVLAEIAGENDGANWYWIVQLNDKRYALITGGCDYTGWDCQSSAHTQYAKTAYQCALLAPEKEEYYSRGNIRKMLIKQLRGKLEIGVSDLSE